MIHPEDALSILRELAAYSDDEPLIVPSPEFGYAEPVCETQCRGCGQPMLCSCGDALCGECADFFPLF